MSIFKKLLKKRYLIPLAVIVIIILYTTFKGGGDTQQTLIIKSGNFTQQVSVAGKVVAAEDVTLGFDQSGRVAGVYAKVGDTVSAGTILAVVENGDLRAELLQKEAALGSEQAKLAALKRGTRPEQLAVSQSAVASAQSSLDQAKESVEDAIKDAYTKSDDAIRGKVDQFMTNPRSSNPKLSFTINDSQLVNSIESQRIQMEKLLNDFPTAVVEVQAGLLKVKNFLSDIGKATNFLTTSNNPSLSQATIDKYKSDVSSARVSIDAAVTSLTAATTAEKSAATALVTAENQLKLEQAGTPQEDIDAQQARVVAAQADVQSARSRVAKTQVVAPFAGIVTKMDVHVGEVVSPSTVSISMISAANFQIESFVPEVNISFIKINDKASVTLDAYGAEVFFDAVVAAIDPAETVKDGVSTYKVTLQFVKNDGRIKSGMTANVSITTEQKQNVFVVPQGVIVTRDGKKYVQVKIGKQIIEREVKLGAGGALGQVEVVSGLNEGDMVLTTPVTQ